MWAERLFLTARRHERPFWEKTALAGARRARVDVEGGWLPAWTWRPAGAPRARLFDTPKTVLLVHGWEGRGSQLAAFVPPLLAEGLRVVTFDAPGHGDAPLPRASVVDHAHAVAAVAKQLGPIHAVIGHSVGGAAALLATRFGLEAERFALIAPPRTPAKFVQTFSKVLRLDDGVRDAMVARVEQRYGLRIADLDALHDATKLYAPLLVVHDKDDTVVTPATGRALADAAPFGMYLETSGLGHNAILRAPEVLGAVTRFVAAGSAPSFAETLDGELFLRDTRW
ncbi:MAG: alpha/beta fold hydrolase [Labilithrix sp.]|nr:alpha/beta fold hydrolase [Labilithrix sp.]MCW5816771.1 alpha/beta fold hydrolase [Labilithrix sp.]